MDPQSLYALAERWTAKATLCRKDAEASRRVRDMVIANTLSARAASFEEAAAGLRALLPPPPGRVAGQLLQTGGW